MKKHIYLWIAVGLLLPLVYFLYDRIDFVWSSKTVMSTVEDVRAHNDVCGGKRKYACTKYDAKLVYLVNDVDYRIEVEAGRERGRNQPLSMADHRVGEAVQVAYDPRKPTRAYRNTWWDIWGAPFIVFLMQIAAFFGNQREHDREEAQGR